MSDRFTFRSNHSVGHYDAARWLAPPPSVIRSLQNASGIACIVQQGHSAAGVRQEVLVAAGEYDVLVWLEPRGQAVDAEVGDARLSVGKGPVTGLFFAAGQPSRWLCAPTNRYTAHLHIPTRLRTALLDSLDGKTRRVPEIYPIGSGARIGQLMTDLLADLTSDAPFSPLLVESYAVAAIDRIVRESAVQASARLAPWQLKRSLDLLQADQDVTLAELAREVRLSVFHFARAFKDAIGLPPHRYQILQRIERAKALLSETREPITEIAARVGYDDPGYFARIFQREVGVTPSRYRRDLQ